MAKAMTAKAAEAVPDKEITALVEIIDTRGLDAKTRNTLVNVAVGFLGSLNERELEAQAKVEALLADPDLNRLLDPKTMLATIKNQEDADTAGRICKELAEGGKEIGELTEKETGFFHRFHKTLTERRGKHQKALDSCIKKLKEGVRLWLLAEQQRVAQAEAAANAKIEQEFGEEAPPVSFEKPKVEGMSGRTVWLYRIPDMAAFIKAVARGKAPQAAVMVNEDWLSGDVTLNHDRAVKDEATGKLFLYEGTVEVFQDLQMARR